MALPTGGTAANVTVNSTLYRVHTFSSPGTDVFNAGSNSIAAELLVVAGGGGGAFNGGGGGGGGGLYYTDSFYPTPGIDYNITVGAGGINNARGGNTTVQGGSLNIITIGGGGGGSTNPFGGAGGSGGSGGGGGRSNTNTTGGLGGAALQPTSVSGGFGNPGSEGANTSLSGPLRGSGGGGAGGAGDAGYSAGNGGIGLQYSISGTATYYAGGGAGGGSSVGNFGTNGLGGGSGSYGGGGRSGDYLQGATGTTGGGGVVIIRYNLASLVYIPVTAVANYPILSLSKYATESVNLIPISGYYGDPPYTYSVSPSLPSGLSFNANTGAITGIPSVLTSETTYTVTIADSTANATATFTLETVSTYGGAVDLVTDRTFAINSTWITATENRNTPIQSCTAIVSSTSNANVTYGVVSSISVENSVISNYKTQRFEKSYPVISEDSDSTSYGSWGDIVIPVTSYTNTANVLYDTPGTYSWTVPEDVTSISAIAIGAGGGGVQKTTGGAGGAGGNLAYVNTVTVTPGSTYTIVIGQGGAPGAATGSFGGNTSMTLSTSSTPILLATGGNGGGTSSLGVADIGTFSSRGGFGGAGGANGGGGGGAAGWSRVGYKNVNYHTFTANGTFTITSGTGTVQYLVVGGGGGGGEVVGGGGGGGNVLQGNVSLTVGSFIVTVGNGGAGAYTNNSATYYGGGSSGNSSSITGTGISVTAQGGGGGGGYDRAGVQIPGSGGGPGGGTSASTGAGVTAGTGSFSGGSSGNNGNSAGGGAGAGFPGTTATNGFPGRGGFGNISAITGERLYYGGGGGGGARNPGGGAAGAGGFGGGGAGAGNSAVEQSQAEPGVPYTGGGGGGGGYNNLGFRSKGGDGGSGVVIVKYYTDEITATGGIVNTYIETSPFHSNTATVPFLTGSWGGNGAAGATSSAGFGSNGGGGGGGGTSLTNAVGGGGGTGILNFGANGAGGSAGSGGSGGSSGTNGTITGNGGAYGGGGSGAAVSSVDTTRGWGGDGALRIIFPGTRAYPIPAYPYPANFANLATTLQAGTLTSTDPITQAKIIRPNRGGRDVLAITVENSSIANFANLNNQIYGVDQRINVTDAATISVVQSTNEAVPAYKSLLMNLTTFSPTNSKGASLNEISSDENDPRLVSVRIANYIVGVTGSTEGNVATSLVQVWM